MIGGTALCVFFCTEAGGWVAYVCRRPDGPGYVAVCRRGPEVLETSVAESPRGALELARAAIADALTVKLYTVGHRPGCGCRACVDAMAAAIAAHLPPAGVRG
jgi:hypothetical protein